MGKISILAENISKKYQIGVQKAGYRTLRESIAKRLTQKNRRSPEERGDIWALKDISIEIHEGDSLGIIGRNGAGKSTLLKILSRITKPTIGRAVLNGRVGSLLEVGTGFHPELTGRENIYLNAAIIGMRRAEVNRKFDEIVSFSEIEKFLDTPVKRYSSGMYVRLAFAVAAHLEPDILLVDEVLAVGDAAFQKKCLGKMGDVAGEGRTVIFVSHNMASISILCKKGILLDNGNLLKSGDINEVIDSYLKLSSLHENNIIPLDKRVDRKGTGEGHFTNVRITQDGQETRSVPMGSTFTIEAQVEVFTPINRPLFGITFKDIHGLTVMRAYSNESSYNSSFDKKNGTIQCTFFDVPLMHGDYQITLLLGKLWEPIDMIENAIPLTIIASDVYGSGILPNRKGGICYAVHKWDIS